MRFTGRHTTAALRVGDRRGCGRATGVATAGVPTGRPPLPLPARARHCLSPLGCHHVEPAVWADSCYYSAAPRPRPVIPSAGDAGTPARPRPGVLSGNRPPGRAGPPARPEFRACGARHVAFENRQAVGFLKYRTASRRERRGADERSLLPAAPVLASIALTSITSPRPPRRPEVGDHVPWRQCPPRWAP